MKSSKSMLLSAIILALSVLVILPLPALAQNIDTPSWARPGEPLILPADTPAGDYLKGYSQDGFMPLEVFSEDGLIQMLPVPDCYIVDPPPHKAARAEDFEVVKLLDNGADSENIVLTILGDGFTASQQDYFIESAQTISNYLLNFFPFSSYKDNFNIYAVKVISNVSGAAQHPSALIDNYFGSTYSHDGQTERLLYTSYSSKVLEVLNTYTPTYNVPIIIVNSTVYGGGGGTWAVTSLDTRAREILVHELGHSLGDLADEYWWRGAEAPNLTSNNNPATIKWRPWLDIENIGIYPHEESPTWFRPHQNCEMRYLNRAFCEVCASQLTLKMSNIIQDPFYGNSSISEVIIPEGKYRLSDYLFYGCDGLKTITIPGSVVSIGRYAFLRCTNLTAITNNAFTPQPINATTFAGVNRANITLYVPAGAAADYLAAGWSGFKQIVESASTPKILYQTSTNQAKIELFNSGGTRIYTTVTTADGRYNLSIPATPTDARYTLVVTKPGYLSYTVKNLTPATVEAVKNIDLRQLAGDIDGNGVVNATDLTYLLSEFNRNPVNSAYPNADIDGNGVVNATDLTYLLAGFNKQNVIIEL